MKSLKISNGFLIRLSRGEKIIESLSNFLEGKNIRSGFLKGIGGASEIELGYYNLETKEYSWKTFSQIHEVLSLLGNISLVNEKPFIHAHVVISNDQFQSFGGHLKEAAVGATLEVLITPIEETVARIQDDEIGLKLLDLPEE